jgi:hypothetical protein
MYRDPRLEILGLCISHLGLFAVAVALTQSCRNSRDLAEVKRDPLYNLGLQFEANSPANDLPPIGPDLRVIRDSDGPKAASLLQLTLQLRRNELDGAASTCTDLGWRRCDAATLASMRTELLK